VKWEPLAAMVALLALGAWLVMGTDPAQLRGIDRRPGAIYSELRVGDQRGVVEYDAAATPAPFRVLFDTHASDPIPEAEFRDRFGAKAYAVATERGSLLFRALNITSWTGVLWVAIGFAGQMAFFGRMMIQWLVSEKQRQSVIPEAFWWLSLVGGVVLFTYFVWRKDIVGVLGQTSGVVIYARNLRLIHKQRRREARQAARAETAVLASPSASTAA
jgi:lipid-A-disaccharide synthase-like uncharacterized protein